jgi:hypothetical protein
LSGNHHVTDDEQVAQLTGDFFQGDPEFATELARVVLFL